MNRVGFLGGSDLAAVLGISPWKTPYQLWEEKLDIAPETETDELREKILKRGKRLEPVVMEQLQDEYDLTVLGRNQVFTDPEHEWMRAEIDFEYLAPDGSTQNGDVKTVNVFAAKDWGESGTDEVPAYYVAQFQWGLMVSGRTTCAVAALFGTDDLRLYYVHRDEEIIAMLRERSIAFWVNFVLREIPPPMFTAEDAARMLRKFDGVTIAANPNVLKALSVTKGIKAAEKRLEAKRDEYETYVKIAIASATGNSTAGKFVIVDEGGRQLASWNEQSATRISAKKVKEIMPERVNELSETSTFRVLRIK